MKTKSTIVAASLVVVLAGCATSANQQVAANNKNSDLVCTFEKTTGSHMKKKICRTKSQIATQAEVAQKTVRRASQMQGVRKL